MSISLTELMTVLTIYAALAGSGLYWLRRRALSQGKRATWAVAVVLMPVPTIIALGLVRPGWPQR
jgi:Gpi18-like mannosyltransferase